MAIDDPSEFLTNLEFSSLEAELNKVDSYMKNFYSGFASPSDDKSGQAGQSGSGGSIEAGFDKIFEKEVGTVIDKINETAKVLDEIRSAYLPWELQRNIVTEGSDVRESFKITDKKFGYESYENAFMRALGMPESDVIKQSGKEFMYRRRASTYPALTNDYSVLDSILLSREIIDLRDGVVSKDFFDMSKIFGLKMINSLPTEQKASLVKLTEKYLKTQDDPDEAANSSGVGDEAALNNLLKASFYSEVKKANITLTQDQSNKYYTHAVINKGEPPKPEVLSILPRWSEYNYIFLPPVQDSAISNCISDPKSIVKKPFSSSGVTIVNAVEPRMSLLEAILRIRLDKVMGLNYEKVLGVQIDNKLKTINNQSQLTDMGNPEKTEVFFEDFQQQESIVENIIVNRLHKVLRNTAKSLAKEIENYVISCERCMTTVESSDKIGTGSPPPDKPKDKPSLNSVTAIFGDTTNKENAVAALKDLKNADEAILFLLSDKEKITDFLPGGVRTGSLREAALFDTLISPISLVKNYLDDQISELEETLEKKRNEKGSPEYISNKISEILGIYRGVGFIDILVFSLALFTLKEDVLIGLLSSNQYSNLKEEFSSSDVFFKQYEENLEGKSRYVIQVESINALSVRVVALYNAAKGYVEAKK